jgi:flagellar motor switch protein FliN/FliY
MTTSQAAYKNYQLFTNAFFSALVTAMTEASGSPWQIAAIPAADPTPDEPDPVRIMLMLDGSLSGEALLEFHRAEAAMLGSMLLGKTADEFGTEQGDALLRLLETAVSELCAALEPEYGSFTIRASLSSYSPSKDASIIQITASHDSDSRVSIAMYIHPELTEALSPHFQAGSGATEASEANQAAGDGLTPEPINLDLVMDVELSVTLRFGKRQLTLREVMELTSGSVVELDREVEEPVELLLNGMVIARGEAVVIDGNYGLRVTEVSQQVSPFALN